MSIPEKPNNQLNAEFSANKQQQQFNRTAAEGRKSAETKQPYVLLNQDMAGAQAMLLTGIRPEKHVRISGLRIEQAKVDAVIRGEESLPIKSITKASQNEREELWKRENRPFKGQSWEEEQQMWENHMNRNFFSRYKGNRAREQFLQGIGIDVTAENPAQDVYREFFGEHDGDVEYFVRKVVQNSSAKQIERHSDVIEELSGLYGERSSEAVTLLIGGLKNAETNSEWFLQRAMSDINRSEGKPRYSSVDAVDAFNKKWDRKKEQSAATDREPTHAQEQTLREPVREQWLYSADPKDRTAFSAAQHRQDIQPGTQTLYLRDPLGPEQEETEPAGIEVMRQSAKEFASKMKQLTKNYDLSDEQARLQREMIPLRHIDPSDMLRIAGERYNLPLAFVTKATVEEGIQEGHLLLGFPDDHYDGTYTLPYYDPAEGRKEANITRYYERGFFSPFSEVTFGEIPDMKPGDIGSEYIHIDKEPWMIYYNGTLMKQLKQGTLYNLQGGVAENVFVPLQPADDAENRQLYSLYMGTVLNGLRPYFGLNPFRDGVRQFEEDWQVKALFDTQILFDKKSSRLI